jgi:putative transposase
MTTPTFPSYAGHRFPAEVISHAVWLYFRFPLSLRMVEEMLATRGIIVSHETVRQWALKFGQAFANQIRRRLPRTGDKWHLDEVVLKIAGVKHWLWRAVDQDGIVLDILVQSRRDKRAAKRLLRKLLKRQCRVPRVMITDKLACTRSRSSFKVRMKRLAQPLPSGARTKAGELLMEEGEFLPEGVGHVCGRGCGVSGRFDEKSPTETLAVLVCVESKQTACEWVMNEVAARG